MTMIEKMDKLLKKLENSPEELEKFMKEFKRSNKCHDVRDVELSHNLGITSVKKAKKQNVTLGTRATVLESMVRSLNREVEKFYKVNPFWGLSEEVK